MNKSAASIFSPTLAHNNQLIVSHNNEILSDIIDKINNHQKNRLKSPYFTKIQKDYYKSLSKIKRQQNLKKTKKSLFGATDSPVKSPTKAIQISNASSKPDIQDLSKSIQFNNKLGPEQDLLSQSLSPFAPIPVSYLSKEGTDSPLTGSKNYFSGEDGEMVKMEDKFDVMKSINLAQANLPFPTDMYRIKFDDLITKLKFLQEVMGQEENKAAVEAVTTKKHKKGNLNSVGSKEYKEIGLMAMKSAFAMIEDISDEGELDTEADVMKEKLLFFHPRSFGETRTFFLAGMINGFLQFAKGMWQLSRKPEKKEIPLREQEHMEDLEDEIDDDPMTEEEQAISLLSFKHCKIALRNVSGIDMFLFGPETTPDACMNSQIERLVELMVFLNGPLEDVHHRFMSQGSNSPYKSEFKSVVQQIGLEMVPFSRMLSESPSSVYDPVPYTELPLKHNSLFIFAKQILGALIEEVEQVKSGCIFYDDGVFCTLFPNEKLTKFVLYRSNLLKKENSPLFWSTFHYPQRKNVSNCPSFYEVAKQQESRTRNSVSFGGNASTATPNFNGLNFENWDSNVESNFIDSLIQSSNTKQLIFRSQNSFNTKIKHHIVFSANDRIDFFPVFLSHDEYEEIQEESEKMKRFSSKKTTKEEKSLKKEKKMEKEKVQAQQKESSDPENETKQTENVPESENAYEYNKKPSETIKKSSESEKKFEDSNSKDLFSPEVPEYMKSVHEKGVYAGLVIIQLVHISLCLIIDVEKIMDVRFVKQLRKKCLKKLSILEQNMNFVFMNHSLQRGTPQYVASTPYYREGQFRMVTLPTNNLNNAAGANSGLPSNSNVPLFQFGTGVSNMSNNINSINSGGINNSNSSIQNAAQSINQDTSGMIDPAMTPLKSNGTSTFTSSKPNSSMAYDCYNGMATASFKMKSNFLNGANLCHGIFDDAETINKVVLKNSEGYFYSKKQFGSEIVFHHEFPVQAGNVSVSVDTNLSDLESLARRSTREDLKINIF